ncbi:hypothetical protein [Bradyrhizobium sp. AS23.2]|uniref:hypothetical protein n=1 Tax=Bradyrhizobium sp. AS23.2 TaxID=1680155 RepID=UPI00093FE1A3|nr:hypothetical protein [Bradyrhizobium sp. AS23.2]OKO84662.1 hypothetical protein AC630_08330 [Bradyrhizobium sp. AS23.2]
MESASVPETNDPKPDEPRADGDLTRAYERIKSAEEDLARLDRLVSGMESGADGPSISQSKASAGPGDDPLEKPSSPQSKVHQESPKENRPIVRAFVGLLLAIGVLGAAFASQYRDEARAIMARWAPPVSHPAPEASEAHSPANPLAVQLAAADEQMPVPAPPVQKDADRNPPAGATPPDQKPAELAQSLKAITDQLASINEKLEQLKSRHEQTLHEQADAIQQLRTAQQKDASDNARLATQVQALQTQLTTLSASAAAKPAARSVVKESDAVARPHIQAAAPPRRPRPPRGPWMPPPYMVDPYGYSDW